MTRKPNTQCTHCSNPLYRRPCTLGTFENVFCNAKCHGAFTKKPVKCAECEKEIPSRKRAITCSKECYEKRRAKLFEAKREGRDLSKKSNDVLKKILVDQRGTKCEICEYPNTKILQVHHKIRVADGGSNDLSNLQLLCPNCHCEIHYGE